MHLYELLACFALMFSILSYSFVVSTKNFDLDSAYELWLAVRKRWRGCDIIRCGRSERRPKRWHRNRQQNPKLPLSQSNGGSKGLDVYPRPQGRIQGP